MRKAVHTAIGLALLSLLLSSCTTYGIYAGNLRNGKTLFNEGKYTEAQRYFEEAAARSIDGAAFTYLAVIAYRQNDLHRAAGLIASAGKSPPDTITSLRMYAYKALILLGLDDPGGMKALKEYIDRYDSLYPLESIKDIKDMWRSGKIDRVFLEAIMDEQIRWYEQDMELYIYNNLGYYSRDRREF
ncbi:MAG: tetratricopeptide repeat protein [Syntrophorhabdaceae bacterium]|nr:tetratricopeptide repeat protein [Syntrophorhabdaceae bacterium]